VAWAAGGCAQHLHLNYHDRPTCEAYAVCGMCRWGDDCYYPHPKGEVFQANFVIVRAPTFVHRTDRRPH
jgi:hypothetical protein